MNTSDMRMYKSKSNGRMSGDSADEILTGVSQNLLRHVTSSERAAGYFDYHKAWWHIEDDNDGIGIDPELYADFPTLSDDDYVLFFTMSDRTAIEDISGYDTGADTETKYGSAYLASDIAAGDLSFDVVVKNAAMLTGNDAIFRNGGTIKITDKTIDTATSGNEETLTLHSSSAVSIASDGVTATLTLDGTTGFKNSYTADGSITRVRSIIEESTIETSVTTAVVTSSAGLFDDSTYEIVLDNIGTIDQDWTLYFTDSSHFRLDGDELGTDVATGIISSNFEPNNPDKSKPYFTINSSAFSGTFASGDTITFTTKPSAFPFGIKRVVPPASNSLANNKVSPVLVIEVAS